MKVLVVYASRHGATHGIAERIAAVLEERGLEVDLAAAADAEAPTRYDAIIVGAAAYIGGWLGEARDYVRHYATPLANRPVWLFSSGPLGSEKVNTKGTDQLQAARPREFDELEELIGPRDERVFYGAYDPGAPPVGLAERLLALTPVRGALPAGDFRDWPDIEAWASTIADALLEVPVA